MCSYNKTHIELKVRVTRPFSISYRCWYIQVIQKAGNPGSKQTRYITYIRMYKLNFINLTLIQILLMLEIQFVMIFDQFTL